MSILLILLLIMLGLAISRVVFPALASGGRSELEAGHTAEIARLREEVDQLGAQVLRLQDEQTFMMRLLTDGSGRGEEAAPPEAADPQNPNPENP